MKSGHLLFSAVQFVFSVLVLTLGALFLGVHYLPSFRLLIGEVFSQYGGSFAFIGYVVMGCGVALLIGFYSMYRGRFYSVQMKRGEVWVDPALLTQYIQEYWAKLFPQEKLLVQVEMQRGGTIGITAEFPSTHVQDHEAFLERAEWDIADLLWDRLKYDREFSVTFLLK